MARDRLQGRIAGFRHHTAGPGEDGAVAGVDRDGERVRDDGVGRIVLAGGEEDEGREEGEVPEEATSGKCRFSQTETPLER